MQGDVTASGSSSNGHARSTATGNDNGLLMDSNMDTDEVTLSSLLVQTLAASAAILEAPDLSTNPAQQAQLEQLLSHLSLCASLISHLALFSLNESLSEVSTPTLRCLLVPFYTAMLELQRRTKDYKTRITVLETAKEALGRYTSSVEALDIVDLNKRKELHMVNGSASNDPTRRREAKIAQFKEERRIKAQIEHMNANMAGKSSASIASGSVNTDPADIEDEVARPLILAQITYNYLKAYNELSSMSQEIELLQNAPNMSEMPSAHRNGALLQDSRERKKEEEEATWRLDAPLATTSGSSNPAHRLIDAKGRPLRPFTILPSGSGSQLDTRLRMQKSVFGYSHRLPTMSVDEYLDMEMERGNFLQGGGAKNTEESVQEEEDKRAYEEEEDNAGGYARQEAGLAKKREWDAYRDEHKRGEGNRMNRG